MMKAVCRRPPCHSFVMLKSFSTASNTPAKKNIQCPIYFKRTGPKGWCPCSVHKTFSRIGFWNKKIVHENSKSWISRETFVTTVEPLNSDYPLFIDNLGLTALSLLLTLVPINCRQFSPDEKINYWGVPVYLVGIKSRYIFFQDKPNRHRPQDVQEWNYFWQCLPDTVYLSM